MERLQKVLARAGVASRRACEALITAGRVAVDGEIVQTLGTKVDAATQTITVDGKPISLASPVCLMLHKPTSYISSVYDPEGRRTVMALLRGVDERVYPVGRLDYDSTGLLLFSNDGELTHRLLHPSWKVEKVYRVTVLGMPEREVIRKLREGVPLEDGVTQPADVRVLRHHPLESVLEITIREGRNRQVRRMFEAVGYPVKRLKRVRFGPLELGGLPPGRWRWLTREEWDALYQSVGLTPPPYRVPAPPEAVRKRSGHPPYAVAARKRSVR
ncbi:pseudouridine synthase [Alicyclobacillus cellulosilyticus]|uniref:pseudouridine synthase n=1 Tax=Alicyclobacillus cellulosilyticus TaxID=1003997 RepID=UPI00166C1FD4|nr:pseudouridine synthase [Alicyclobacillus cellulosilyticus]